MIFAGHHAANEVTRKEDGVAVAENVLQVRLITARGICMCQTCERNRDEKQCFSLCCDSGEDTAGSRVWGDGHLVKPSFSGPLAFLIANFSVSLEKRLAQIHLGGEIL